MALVNCSTTDKRSYVLVVCALTDVTPIMAINAASNVDKEKRAFMKASFLTSEINSE